MSLVITPLMRFPMIEPGDDLSSEILSCLEDNNLPLVENDILVITQKVVSKAENRFVDLSTITPREKAIKLGLQTEKDPRLVEVILRESNEVVRFRKGSLVVEHKLGFICASAGIDHSNISGGSKESNQSVLLLPVDPSASAKKIRDAVFSKYGKNIGVLIIDSQGRAWRNGVVGMSIGLSGIPPLIDERGWKDLYGSTLEITIVGVVDELAAAASLMMGQANEGTPVVHVRGFPYKLAEGNFNDLMRSKETDLFR